MQKRKTCWKSHIDAEKLTLTIKYYSQEGEIVGETTRDLSKYSDNMISLLALHGDKQRTQDSTADFAKFAAKYGWDQAILWVQSNHDRVYKQQCDDEWSARGEGVMVRVTILMEAVAKAYGQTIDVALAKVYSMTKEQKKALMEYPAIAKAILEVKAERAAAKAAALEKLAIDAGDLPDLGFSPEVEQEEEVE